MSVYQILASPKYTGHMVFGRRRTRNGKTRPVPPAEWLWSPGPAHHALITCETYDAAQADAAAHAGTPDSTGPSPHPLTRRTYPLHSRVRCNICQRRMCGITRPPPSRPGEAPGPRVYYICPHDPRNARHAAARPRTVTIREDTLARITGQFLAERVLGPGRAALLARQLPQDADAQRDQQRAALTTELARITTAQNSHIPILGDILTDAPAPLRQQLYQAFDLQILYRQPQNQATVFVTITDSTPGTVAALLATATDNPGNARTASQTSVSDPSQRPVARKTRTANRYLRQGRR